MKNRKRFVSLEIAFLLIAGIAYLGTIAPAVANEETGDSLASQIQELRVKVARLEAALKENHQGRAAPSKETRTMRNDREMGMMKGQGKGMMKGQGKEMMKGQGKEMMGRKRMGMMGNMKPTTSDDQESTGQKRRMGMMGHKPKGMKGGKGMGMSMMARMKGSHRESSDFVLPPFAGTPEIYHIGSAEFFLDLAEKIDLTADQRDSLEKVKTKSLADASKVQAKIDEAEQQLWDLTGSDKPDGAKIQTKIREIARLEGDRRLAFIRAVGEAAKALTNEQRELLSAAEAAPPGGAQNH